MLFLHWESIDCGDLRCIILFHHLYTLENFSMRSICKRRRSVGKRQKPDVSTFGQVWMVFMSNLSHLYRHLSVFYIYDRIVFSFFMFSDISSTLKQQSITFGHEWVQSDWKMGNSAFFRCFLEIQFVRYFCVAHNHSRCNVKLCIHERWNDLSIATLFCRNIKCALCNLNWRTVATLFMMIHIIRSMNYIEF